MTDKPAYEELARNLDELRKEFDEYRETNRKLRVDLERYKAIFDRTENAVAVYRAIDGGADFVFGDFNRAAECIEKISRNEVVGKSVLNVFPSVREFGLFDVFRRVWRTGRPEHHDVRFYTDGRISGWRENFVFKLPSGEIVALYSDETERKRKEEYLSHFEKAVETASDAIGMSTPEGEHWYQNKAMTDLFGAVGNDPPASVYADEHAGRDIFETIMAGGHWSGEVAMKGRGGKLLDIFLRAYAIKNDDGKIIGLVGLHTDITRQKRTEKELRKARRLLETIIEQSPVPMVVATPSGDLKMINTACREQLMIGNDIPEGANLFELKPTWRDYDRDGNFVATEKLPLALALQGVKTQNLEIRVVRKDGSERWEIVSGTPIYDDDGNLVAGFVMFPDITPLKKAEEALKNEMAFTDFALNAQTDTFFVFNPASGEALRWNRAFREISGYGDDEIRSLKIPESYYSQGDLEKAGAAIEQVFTDGKATVAISLATKDGRRIPTEYSVSLLPDTGTDEQYMVSVGRDITEQMRVQEKLRASRERLAMALDIGNAGIWELDLVKNTIHLDSRFRAMLGYASEDIPTAVNEWKVYHHPDEFDGIVERLDRHMTGKTPVYESEHRIKSKQGEWIWVFTRGKVVEWDDNHTPKSLVGIAMDVTDRKVAERELLDSQRFVRHIVEATPNILYIYNLTEKRNVFANLELTEFLGYTPKQIMEMGASLIKKIMHPEDIQSIARHHERLSEAKDGEVMELTYRAKQADGKWRWLKSRDVPFSRTPEGSVEEILGIAEDITKHRNAVEALRASEEKYRLLYTTMSEGVCVHDIIYDDGGKPVDYRITDVNPSYESITGLAREKAIGAPASKLYGAGSPPYLDIYAEVADSGNPFSFETYFPPMEKHFTISVFCLRKGKFATVFSDVTDKKKLESQLRQSQKMEAIGTLAGGIAHDFNNILGIIVGNAELALDDVPDWNPARMNLDAIREAGLRARDVIRQLLSFSRKTESKRETVRLFHIVRETMKLLRSSIPKNIDIRTDIPAQSDAVLVDPAQIHQILINLCTNAAHAMEENGGVLTVGLKNMTLDESSATFYTDTEPGDYVRLSVSDTGDGIPPEIRERIFDPYFTTKDVHKGTGMGLAVVHGIVKNHGGAVSVYSEVGQGTTFRLLFPAVKDRVETAAKRPSPLPKGNENILLVDDEKALAKMGREMLKRLGYSVETETDPRDALEKFRANPGRFDLVITDMAMPHMTGDRLAQEMKHIRPDIGIILCTGFSEKIDKQKALEMGIDKYMEKPLNKKDISLAIREVLDKN